MTTKTTIPGPVMQVVADVLASRYYSHRAIDTMFVEAGAPGEAPPGSLVTKIKSWLKRINDDDQINALEVLGGLLSDLMDSDSSIPEIKASQERISAILRRSSLSYQTGGRVLGGSVGPTARSLSDLIRDRNLPEIQREFDRALASVDLDPPASLTAACALLESVFATYIDDEKLPMPKDRSVKPLWSVVQRHLGLDPSALEDDDLKKVLGGLSSVVDGIGSLRTHAGSAHGHGRKRYRVEPRHARLAVHAANTTTTFIIETWLARKSSS